MQKITSITHAQEVLGTQINFDNFPAALASVGIPEKDIAPQIANYSLWLVTEANNKLNNWDNKKHNPEQVKYSIWAPYIVAKTNRPSGFGLAFCGAGCWRAGALVGARLEVGSAGEAKYIFEDFNELFDLAWLFQEEK